MKVSARFAKDAIQSLCDQKIATGPFGKQKSFAPTNVSTLAEQYVMKRSKKNIFRNQIADAGYGWVR
jgi:hypothetical protein